MKADHLAESLKAKIHSLSVAEDHILIAIDGNCAAGKTTLAAQLQREMDCTIIHMDHFFLRPEQRTPERLKEPGGNVDYERFQAEVLQPLRAGLALSYRPYDCHTQAFGQEVAVEPHGVTVIEGSYSCHPMLRKYYDLRVFLSVNCIEQLRRIRQRNGLGGMTAFQERWIPLEEAYFTSCQVREHCDLVYISEERM